MSTKGTSWNINEAFEVHPLFRLTVLEVAYKGDIFSFHTSFTVDGIVWTVIFTMPMTDREIGVPDKIWQSVHT